ncbi:uncharacterized protein LOC105174627 [Sesamum indicum]|uniref:Uncharacterized protein LOC105174627 n=1 Tax=Sesamum indicum TaxID=4182 RepID=A0A6I9UKZ2_SESIN|nr:uncharacterized protein LOC105174627 [Sesamum indicum]XP_011095091.1 uncharacterized protein LOC105174627 [Sesamum indicum]
MGKSSSQLIRRRRELKNNDDDNSNKAKKTKTTAMEPDEGGDTEDQPRLPLSEVVSDCTERWFQDTLKEAKAGDVNMQVLVGQMYYSGYGVPKDADKGKFWMNRASRMRSSVWKLSHKRPGYNASDSDSESDELAGDS